MRFVSTDRCEVLSGQENMTLAQLLTSPIHYYSLLQSCVSLLHAFDSLNPNPTRLQNAQIRYQHTRCYLIKNMAHQVLHQHTEKEKNPRKLKTSNHQLCEWALQYRHRVSQQPLRLVRKTIISQRILTTSASVRKLTSQCEPPHPSSKDFKTSQCAKQVSRWPWRTNCKFHSNAGKNNT